MSPGTTHVLATPKPVRSSSLIHHFSFWSEIRQLLCQSVRTGYSLEVAPVSERDFCNWEIDHSMD